MGDVFFSSVYFKNLKFFLILQTTMSFFKKERRIWHKLAYTCLKNVCASLVTNIDLRLAKCIGGGDVVLGAIILRLVKKKYEICLIRILFVVGLSLY